jgi:hypothetical protein
MIIPTLIVAGWLKNQLASVVMRSMLFIVMTDLTEICVKVYKIKILSVNTATSSSLLGVYNIAVRSLEKSETRGFSNHSLSHQ